jgi:3-deoxy-D-manno-octulosonic-acid transferase
VSWFPLDFTWAVNAALTRVRPALVVLMELELWPNFVAECERQLVPVAVVNARMSERSAWRFGLLPRWARSMFSRLSLVAAQSEAAGQRLRKLGVPQERVVVTGSIKFDGVATDRGNPATLRLRALLGLQGPGPVFIAGSTQAPEEQYALDAWERARMRHPDLRLILVPRHRERFNEVAGLVESRGWPLRRRSRVEVSAAAGAGETSDGSTAAPVILLDTIGELSACWGLADVAFVGGSFGSRGGQNMIEPAAYGACVLFGPNTRNFRDVVAVFREAEACRELATPEDLCRALLELLNDPGARERLSHAAQQLVLRQQGATAETIVLLQRLLVDAAGQGTDGVRVAA